ncbi:hypothetical protein [Paenibacillus sp. 1001270B_150601_E10]|uniref:hypothetical protein n=1 Tax=Paenibacillus sp. 1001270B_150601_E10 TaxID=2787079 RepID=UPI0018A0CD60|nr:hypothetical protein [Paenibacillus sp. 1001270B_150601_E10]
MTSSLSSINIVSWFFTLISWAIIIFLGMMQYRKQKEKPAWWKIAIVVIIGIFSFSWKTQLFGVSVKIAILPLGVWLIAMSTQKHAWEKYRPFAWVGFWCNYVFLFLTLVSAGIHSLIYPVDKPETFLADLDHVVLVSLHPSAPKAVLDNDYLQKMVGQLHSADKTVVDWYNRSVLESSPQYKTEQFPYELTSVHSRWGSGLQAVVYIEKDGKGLLISTVDNQYYYRSEKELMKIGDVS